VFVLLGSLAGTGPAVRLGRLGWFLAVALAAAFAWLGFGPLVAQTAAASWVRATVVDPDGAAATPAERLAMLDRAVRWHPSESRFRTLRIGARIAALPHGLHPTTDAEKQALAAVFAASAEDMTTIARLDPDNTNALFTIAELAHAAGNRQAARAALTRILQLDPRDPRATLLLAVLLCESGEVPAGIAVLRADPHPRLREGLARHLQELADAPSLRDDADGAALLRHEARFVRALDQVEQRPGAPLADAAVQAYASRAGTGDVRARILLARQLAARGDTEAAAALSARFHEPGERIELSFADRRLLAAVLDELRRVPAWRTALDR
jgi:Flp pilus assembly protein TadD